MPRTHLALGSPALTWRGKARAPRRVHTILFTTPPVSARYADGVGDRGERASLLGRISTKTQNRGSWTVWLLLIISVLATILLCWEIDRYTNPDRSEVRDRIRREWSREVNDHKFQMEQWAAARLKWGRDKAEWAKEESAHDLIRQDWSKSVARHERWTQRADKQRLEWDMEVREHSRLEDRMNRERKDWAEERYRHEDDMNRVRKEWAEERHRYEDDMNRVRKEWAEESAKREQGRRKQRETDIEWEEKEHKRREEEEERNRAGMFWSALDPGKCSSYGTRKYQSILENIPEDYKGNRIHACMETVLDIHGRKVKPAYCEDLGNVGLRGTWNIDFNEPSCTPWWGQYKEKACTAPRSGLREIEQHLENLSPNEAYDRRDVCSKTSTSFGGRSFDGPHSCVNWGSYDSPKLFGYWRVTDDCCS